MLSKLCSEAIVGFTLYRYHDNDDRSLTATTVAFPHRNFRNWTGGLVASRLSSLVNKSEPRRLHCMVLGLSSSRTCYTINYGIRKAL